jgi:hypothetical protein
MHSLIGERFLRKFVGAIRHRHRFIPRDETVAGDHEDLIVILSSPENQDAAHKEVQNIDKPNKKTSPLNQEDRSEIYRGE